MKEAIPITDRGVIHPAQSDRPWWQAPSGRMIDWLKRAVGARGLRPAPPFSVTHKRTRPYRPQTNGKVERFHRILLEEWAYIRDWTSEAARVVGYGQFKHFYNQYRPHGALGWQSPMTILARCLGDTCPACTTSAQPDLRTDPFSCAVRVPSPRHGSSGHSCR